MIEISEAFDIISKELEPTLTKLGFSPLKPENAEKGSLPVFTRDSGQYLAYGSEKGNIRLLFSDNKIVLLAGDDKATSEDDSDFSHLASFLLVPDEYNAKDAKSVAHEIAENLDDAYSPKQIAKRQQNVKAQATVTRSQVKSGALLYDAATLAIRLSALYPELKDLYKAHVERYDEFLCEDFFMNEVNPRVYATIRENNPQKMKKLFNILNDVYEDGSNEVQDVIVVTMLSSYDYTNEMHSTVLSYVSDTMMETFIRVNKYLKKSKSAKMRLENPPKYKPKKQKKRSSLVDRIMGTDSNSSLN